MKQKHIGIIILIVSIVIALVILNVKINEDHQIDQIVKETGSCYLSDGTCLHEERSTGIYILGWAVAAALFLFALYITFIDRTQEFMEKHQIKVSQALKESKKKDEFNAFLTSFSEDERKILKTVKENEGIKQSTIRYKTGISKTSVSLILKSLEERGFISRKQAGKTKQVFLIKKF